MKVFEYLIDGFAAFNQLVLLAGALICGSVGAALLGNALFWKIHAIRVQGRLIGVRQYQNMFRSVYRYTLPSGQSYDATSNEGSGSLKGRETGATRSLLVLPEHTDEVQEASSHVWTVVGLLFLAVAVWMFRAALKAWPLGPATWLAGGVFLLYSGFRIWRSVLPAEKRLGSTNFKAMIAQRRAADAAVSPLLRSEDIRATPDWRANEEKQQALRKRWTPALLLFGAALLTLGAFLSRTLVHLESAGLRAPGSIQSLEYSSSQRRGSYYPVVIFTDAGGTRASFRDRIGSNPPAFRAGDAVTVLYVSGEPRSAMIDRGWVNWLPSGLSALFGALLCLVGFRALR
jgi:hypothetical protein